MEAAKKPSPIKLHTPSNGVLEVDSLAGSQGLSELFHFTVGFAAPAGKPLVFKDLLGQPASIELAGATSTSFHGLVVGLTEEQQPQPAGAAPVLHYRAELAPQAFLATLGRQSRIFQDKTVPEILKTVLAGSKIDDQLKGAYQPRNYCVQYGESDFAFASRLMEEEGIFYFFKHTASSHTLVLGDAATACPDLPGGKLPLAPRAAGRAGERIWAWEKTQELRSEKVVVWDDCFQLPGKHLEAECPIAAKVTVGSVDHSLNMLAHPPAEEFDFPGGYAKRYDGVNRDGGEQASNLQKIFSDNKQAAAVGIQRQAATAVGIQAAGACPRLVAGHVLELDAPGPTGAAGRYLITRVEHALTAGPEPGVENRLRCMPAALPFRPARSTPRPSCQLQTAVVVGPSGDEVFTDKYGRVKVQFPWDRVGKSDQGSSAWLRVSQLSTGKNIGALFLPCVGEEVLVGFVDGDADQPVIVGRVYNAANMPPVSLPADKWVDALVIGKPGSGDKTPHELRVVCNNEGILLQAQKTVSLVAGKSSLTLKYDGTIELAGAGTSKLTVEANGAVKLTGGGTSELDLKVDGSLLQAQKSLSLVAGKSSLTLKDDGAIALAGAGTSNLTVGPDGAVKLAGAGKNELDLRVDGSVGFSGTDVQVH